MSIKTYLNELDALIKAQEEKPFKSAYCTLILANRGEGKTALGYTELMNYKEKGKKVYVYNHPKPSFLKVIGVENIANMNELNELYDSAVLIDEPQIHFPKYDKRNNEALLLLATIARQKGLNLIFVTSDSRWVNKATEAYIDKWIVKQLDFDDLKRGSKAKKIIKEQFSFTPETFTIPKEKYLLYMDECREIREFKEPEFYCEAYSKPYDMRITLKDLKKQLSEKLRDSANSTATRGAKQ